LDSCKLMISTISYHMRRRSRQTGRRLFEHVSVTPNLRLAYARTTKNTSAISHYNLAS